MGTVIDRTVKIVNQIEYERYSILAPADRFLDALKEPKKVISIDYLPNVAGTDASAVTAVLRKCPVGTAAASGTSLHASGSFDLKGTVGTSQGAVLASSDATLTFAAGDRLGFDLTGVSTAVDGFFVVGWQKL